MRTTTTGSCGISRGREPIVATNWVGKYGGTTATTGNRKRLTDPDDLGFQDVSLPPPPVPPTPDVPGLTFAKQAGAGSTGYVVEEERDPAGRKKQRGQEPPPDEVTGDYEVTGQEDGI